MPLRGGSFVALPLPRSTDSRSSGKTARESQVYARREERVDEAACVSGNTGMGCSIRASAVGPVGRVLDVGDELGVLEERHDSWGLLQAVEVVVFAGGGVHLSLAFGGDGLVADDADRAGAVVERDGPDPATGI